MSASPEFSHAPTPAEQQDLAPQAQEEPYVYRQLVDRLRDHDKLPMSGEHVRTQYLQLTDGLIHQMTDGVKMTDASGETTIEKPDIVIWLDKSARPIARFTKALWPRMAVDPETGEVPDMPDFKFINFELDRHLNAPDNKNPGEKILDMDAVDDKIFQSLRSVFVPNRYKEGLTVAGPEMDDAPSYLDGKNVLVVDEVKGPSGRTLKYSQDFLRRAFPTAKIGGAYWMSSMAKVPEDNNNERAEDDKKPKVEYTNLDAPVWYHYTREPGRGIGNVNVAKNERSQRVAQRLGSLFLSAALPGGAAHDKMSIEVRSDLKQLAVDPDVPIQPAMSRGYENIHEPISLTPEAKAKRKARYDARVALYNPGQVPADVIRKAVQIKATQPKMYR